MVLRPIASNPLLTFDGYHRKMGEFKMGADSLPQRKTALQALPEDFDIPDLRAANPEDAERRRPLEKSIRDEALQRGQWSIIPQAGGAGRRFIDDSERVPDSITKATLPVFEFLHREGLSSALSLSLNGLSEATPPGGRLHVAIVPQDINETYVRDAINNDPHGAYDPKKLSVSYHALNGIPPFKVKPGAKIVSSPPGALAGVMAPLVDGTLLRWAMEGVLYTKVVNGDDVGGVPDGF